MPVHGLVLPTLESPHDLRGLSLDQLKLLAAEIREELCQLSRQRAVHFASNLGVVELTIALHSVFDFSYDRLIWDTGHQTYPHKLLTGRYGRFQTIRTRDGLMGFPNPEESEYDLMMTGHAGCSVGTAVGLACGDELLAHPDGDADVEKRDRNNGNVRDRRHSVAVIGDGAFASGPVFEAMGHAGWLRKNITVILNDNKMSICPRAGGIAAYLDRLRMAKTYLGFKHRVRVVVRNLPYVNKFAERFFGSLKSAVKAMFMGGMLFEELGFRYIGPIDGHDIRGLQRYLNLVRKYEEPVLLHVFTEKGRGYDPAAADPTVFHAPSPGLVGRHTGRNRFEPAANSRDPDKLSLQESRVRRSVSPEFPECPANVSFTEHVRDAVLAVMRENDQVCAITAAMAQGTMLEPVRDEFPTRFFDVGICESHAVIFAAGLAKSGLRPLVAIYSTFMQRAYDQIFQEVSLQNLPVTLLLDRAGLAAADGPTHHGVFDIAYLRPFPNLVVLAPGDAADVEPMIRFAATHSGPVAIRYPKTDATLFKRDVAPVVYGKAELLREGADGYIVVAGGHIDIAIEAVKELGINRDGLGRVDLGVINARFIKPLDTDAILEPLRDGKFLITLEEGMLAGGFGSAILEAANEAGLDTRRIRRIGIGDRYVRHAEREEQLEELGFTVSELFRTGREMLNKKY